VAPVQSGYDRRFEWGRAGAASLASVVDVLVVVDVLSFSTAVDVAVGRGAVVYPARWRDARSPTVARDVCGVLAVGRSEASPDHPYSLSPQSLSAIPAGSRLVLPSPNGASIVAAAVDGDRAILTGCLRNAAAVGRAAGARGEVVGVIAAGEQWPDGSLRPALEDLVGAGKILHALGGNPSPEASAAIAAAWATTTQDLGTCTSARELIETGYDRDVAIALMTDVSAVAPLLLDGAFVDAGAG
jgi:2-phosphosulfolactate phosphatase